MPRICIIEDDSLNAYASGLSPQNSIIAFSRGLLNKLEDHEIEAVAAHELTHIINRDVRLMVIAIIFVGIIQTIAEVIIRIRFFGNDKESRKNLAWIFLIQIAIYIIAFFFIVLIQLALSRKREYLADAGSAELTKSPASLISALQKISADPVIEAVQSRNLAQICIESPLAKDSGFFSELFATHPSIANRIQVLQQL